MPNRINRYWRIFATGLSFLIFGLGGVLLRVLVFPVLRLFIRQQSDRRRVARDIVRRSFQFFIGLLQLLGVLRFRIYGLEKLNRCGLLIVANHPTLIDTVFLMSLVRDASCIVKSDLVKNPFTRGPVLAAGYVTNADGAGLVDDCIHSLENGSNLIVFPEGTRTQTENIMAFKRGVANIAIRGRRNITPVYIRCTPAVLKKNMPWWQVSSRCPNFEITIGEDIAVLPFMENAANETLAVRELTQYLQNYFNRDIDQKLNQREKKHEFA
ncbi:MAG: 1-acyl-sn-glycerol-3-phosphate acyltransferase [Methylobacillus sp.]|nr:1-acyl-sn-glycerol-3-phosphate acyltransferase [Methylobacillus sp.]